jgi:hypothetical protein
VGNGFLVVNNNKIMVFWFWKFEYSGKIVYGRIRGPGCDLLGALPPILDRLYLPKKYGKGFWLRTSKKTHSPKNSDPSALLVKFCLLKFGGQLYEI